MDIKEIEESRKRGYYGEYGYEIDALLSHIKELEVGIKKHRNTKIESNYKIEQMELRDEELYELVWRESK